MADHELRFSRGAIKEADRLPGNVTARVAAAIEALARNPRPIGCQKLQDEEDLWRIRVGDYRIIYQIETTHRVVFIRRIRHRREVYRGL